MSDNRRRGPYSITCPVCGSAPDVPCTNPITGEPYRSRAPHLARITEAAHATDLGATHG